MHRPTWDEYYMGIARAVSSRSNCIRRNVGALIVVQNAIIAAGYNICVHAEQNAIVLAARHGNSTSEGKLYTTLRPCFGCAKEAIQAGIREIVFAEPYQYDEELEEVYRRLHAESGISLRHHSGR